MKKNKFIFTTFIVATFFIIPNFIFAEDSDDDYVIQVTAPKIKEPVAEQKIVINQDEIEKSHGENLCTLLQNKGVQILNYGAYGLESKPSVRGFTDETVRVVIDGICVNNAQYGTFDFSAISLNQIEKIEIIKGGFSEGVSDEGAVGGTIYITTKKNIGQKEFNSDTSIKTFFNTNFFVDSIHQSLGFSSPIFDNKTFFSVNGNFVAAKNMYLFNNYKNKITQRENSSVWDSTVGLSISHFFDSGMFFSISDNIYAGNKNCPGPENSTTPGLQKDYDNRFIFNFTIPNIKNIFSWENNLGFLSNVRFYKSPSENSSHFVNTLTYTSYLSFFGNDYFNENIGFTFDGVFLDSSDDGKHNQFSFVVKSNSKIYFDYDWALTVPLSFKFQGNNFAFVPKIGVNKKFIFGEFIFDFYRMIQFPNMDDLYWNGSGAHGNPNLLPEDGFGGEIAFNSFLDFLPFSICIFSNYYKNKIQWASSGGTFQPENIASAFYLGFDFDFEKKFFDDLLEIKFNCEYLYTSLMNKNNSLTYGKKIMWTPDFVAALIVGINLDAWKFIVDASYTGIRYVSNLNTRFLNPYVLLNASATYTGFPVATPYLKLDNILCQDYESVESYPMPRIAMTIGCSIKTNW